MNFIKSLPHLAAKGLVVILAVPFILTGLVIELILDGIKEGRYLYQIAIKKLMG